MINLVLGYTVIYMRILGIDYGTKRVGLATADTDSGMAFPRSVINNDKDLLKTIAEIKKKENIAKIVLGESKNLNGTDNDIMDAIRKFKAKLETELGVEVILQPEFFSTYGASRIQGDSDMIDASAAAIVLQTYVDQLKNIK
ncbi:MAG: Holliday junction resolvase YqgF, putative holliday junction resolvase [Candidatus Taylorbacteria bacterium]|nr:Holliday junction resolvase YqgF, putative holliday junction resolvase [Candidatus Taylorbacteria bacterium]